MWYLLGKLYVDHFGKKTETNLTEEYGLVALPWWRQQMETFSALMALCEETRTISHRWVDFPHKGQWCGALMFSLMSAWTKGWAKNRDAGDLIRHRAHYDVTVRTPDGHFGVHCLNVKYKIIQIKCKHSLESNHCACYFSTDRLQYHRERLL